jgi:hypothetical protein
MWWSVTTYPTAGEAVVALVSGPLDADEDHEVTPSTEEEIRRAALCRARSKARRYVKGNGIDRLWTLTYAEAVFDPARVVRDVGLFFRRLRRRLGGRKFPYLWVLEWHPGGHGLHVHFGLARYVPKDVLAEAWGLGFVDGRRLKAVGPRRRSAVAGYLVKYLVKAFEDESMSGSHRYEVGQGFAPETEHCERLTEHGAVFEAVRMMGGELPSFVWRSEDLGDEWPGLPVRVLFFDL